MIGILNLGSGNSGSLKRAFSQISDHIREVNEPRDLEILTHIVFPGVGNFDYAMQHLKNSGLQKPLTRKIACERIPTLGICLGMQILGHSSEEGHEMGLGLIDAITKRLKRRSLEPIPHMGWNTITICHSNSLIDDTLQSNAFYFSHSYHLVPNEADLCISKTCYTSEFVAGIQDRHVFGVQFHPEKSYDQGLRLLANFVKFHCV